MTSVINDDHVNWIMSAGLTNLEARVFLTILTLKNRTVNEISRVAGIDRSNVYKTLKRLEHLELLERNLGKTITYTPIPLPIATSVLLHKKKEEYITTVKSLEQLAKQVDFFKNNQHSEKRDFFKIHPGGSQTFSRKLEQVFKKVKNKLDLIGTAHREPNNDSILEIFEIILNKGINVRCIIDRSSAADAEFNLKFRQFRHLIKYPNFEIKFCYTCKRPYGIICDDNLVILILDDNPPLKHSRSLWTNNKQILLNFKEHFQINWEKAHNNWQQELEH